LLYIAPPKLRALARRRVGKLFFLAKPSNKLADYQDSDNNSHDRNDNKPPIHIHVMHKHVGSNRRMCRDIVLHVQLAALLISSLIVHTWSLNPLAIAGVCFFSASCLRPKIIPRDEQGLYGRVVDDNQAL
jgi:hypothetical protein